MNVEIPYYENNILFRYLVGFDRFKIFRFIVILLFWYGVSFIICFFNDIHYTNDECIGFLNDIVSYAIFFMYVALIGCTLYTIRKLDSLLNQLDDFIDISNDQVKCIVDDIRDVVGLRSRKAITYYIILLVTMFILVCIFQIIVPVCASETKTWALSPTKYPVLFCYAVVWALFQWVVVVGNILWYVLSIAFTVFPLLYKYAKKDNLQIIPLAPDCKGGLTPIGDLSFAITLTMSCGMFLLISWLVLFGVVLSMWIGFILYFLALTALFFLPLQSVHLAMKNAKYIEISRLANLFRMEYSKLPEVKGLCELQHDEQRHLSLRSRIEYLADLERLFRRVEAMPVWPYNFAMLRNFVSLIFVPMLLFVIQLVSENYLTRMLESIKFIQ